MSQTFSSTYDQVVKLTEALTNVERQALITHLQQQSQKRPLTSQEWRTLFEANMIRMPVLRDFSNRRDDWYGDDGR